MMQVVIDSAATWLPFVAFALVMFVFLARSHRNLQSPDGRSYGQLLGDYTRETRRLNENLERLFGTYEARISRLESELMAQRAQAVSAPPASRSGDPH